MRTGDGFNFRNLLRRGLGKFRMLKPSLFLVLLVGCKDSKPKMTMAPEDVINAVKDYAERGCACEADKECFREIRDEWDAAKKQLVFNAKLLTGADLVT